jgi:adenosylcobinamide-GDP ribazoletransferase
MKGLRLAVAMFTILPVPRRWHAAAGSAGAAGSAASTTVRWLPLVGAALGGLAGLPAAAILAHDRGATLLAAALAVVVLVILSRALHLDGLADTADGLGSRKPPDEAVLIMRRSDIGPFGVVTLVLVLAVDMAAVATLSASGVWRATAALAVAAATGRLAVAHAALPAVLPARGSSFGALVAGGTSRATAGILTVLVLAGGAGLAAAVDASSLGWVAAQAVALLVAAAFRVHTSRRLGGVTGDVFGALIEIATAVTLVGFAAGN